jgi:hypothetical protein
VIPTARPLSTRRRSRVLGLLLAVIVATTGLAHAPASVASAACAGNSGRRLAGTIEGSDGRYLWAFIGVEFMDAAGNKIGQDGCRLSDSSLYSVLVRVNRQKLSGHGATSGSGLTKSWEVANIPSNAATVWMEAYPMTNDPFETVSRVRYGHAMRRAVPLHSPTTPINLKLPLRCSKGGQTGTISGRFVVNGKPVVPERVWAWNESPDTGSYIMGWGMAELRKGWFRVENLAPNQDYVVWATYGGSTQVFHGLRVNACRDTRLDVARGWGIADTDAIVGLNDVKLGSFYAVPAAWALSKGITTGVGGTRSFAPARPVTRGEMVTFLWRAAGSPSASTSSGFSDVPTSAFYARAVTWARQKGITTGVGGTNLFEPNRPVTRGELATFLWRSKGSPPASTYSGFADVPQSAFYARAVTWARQTGVTTGVGGTNLFEPNRSVTRGEMITMLWRSAGKPAHGKPPVTATQTCASFSSYSKAKAFRAMYAPWGDLASLGPSDRVCPLTYGSPQ